MIGTKEVKKALKELYKKRFILRYKKTNQIHVSLNIKLKKEIDNFINTKDY